MKYRLFESLLVLLLLTCPPVARGQDVGILLGLRFEDSTMSALPYYIGEAGATVRPAYQTLLLARRSGKTGFVGSAQGLLVPRDTVFWRVDAKRSIYNSWVEDFVWSGPEGLPPTLPGIPAYNGEHCEGHRMQVIHYAGTDYLALEQRSAGYCEDAAHPWHFRSLAIVPVDSTTHLGLPIADVLGSAGAEALHSASAAHLAAMPDEEERERFMQEADEANWGLVRQQGRWRVRGRLDPSEVSNPVFTDFRVDAKLPPALVRYGELFPSWETVRAAAPDAVDALSSPDRDLLVILHPDSLTVHPLTGEAIHPASFSMALPPGSVVVMAHWGSGRRLERWTTRFQQHVRPASAGTW